MAINGYGLAILRGREVKINRGGPDSVTGVLVDVGQDYLAVQTKNGIVYINDAHIKSLSETGRSAGSTRALASPIRALNFLGVMQALRLRPVQINRGGPEKLTGVLVEANQNYVVLTVKNNEFVRIPVFHIKSISLSRKDSQSGSNQSGGNQAGNSQSRGNQAGSSQSRGNQARRNQSRGNQSKGNRR